MSVNIKGAYFLSLMVTINANIVQKCTKQKEKEKFLKRNIFFCVFTEENFIFNTNFFYENFHQKRKTVLNLINCYCNVEECFSIILINFQLKPFFLLLPTDSLLYTKIITSEDTPSKYVYMSRNYYLICLTKYSIYIHTYIHSI